MKIPKLLCRAEISSFDKEKKTIDLVWATEKPYKRSGFWDDPYMEILSLAPGEVRLDRLNKGAPLLNTHAGWNLSSQIGVVESASIEGGRGIARVRFSDRPQVADIVSDVGNGIIKNVSVGYRVYKYKDETQDGDRIKTLRATDWEPMEISLVPIPADDDAQVRQEKVEMYDVLIENERANMNVSETTITTPVAEEKKKEIALPAFDQEKIKEAAIFEERKRVSEIATLIRKANLSSELAESLVSEGATIEHARERVLNTLIERSKATQINNSNAVEVGDQDETQTRKMAVENSLLHRFDPAKNALIDPARKFRSRTLLEIARETLLWKGIKVDNLSKNDLAIRALHTTSDFPNILLNVATKTLRDGYEIAPQTFVPFARFVPAVDFKPMYRASLGEAPQLEKVTEGKPFSHGTMGEGSENYHIDTYGKIIGITRKAIINDDLGAFTRIPYAFGIQAAALESNLFWAIVTDNAAMGDTYSLFSTEHSNLAGSGAAIAIATISAARLAMRSQLGIDAETHIDVQPTHLVVPVAQQTLAQQYVTLITPTQASNVNPFTNLGVVAEPRLDDSSGITWYVFSSAALIDMIEIATLDGVRGPIISTIEEFDFDGIKIRAYYDIGGAVIDYRGFYQNPGA